MPDLDGAKASRILREDPLTAVIPIVAMSVGDIEDEQTPDGKPIWAGRLQKPVSNELLLPLVNSLVSHTDP